MPYRSLVLVSGLTVGDYGLWNWSLNANHDVVALISGLTLPPLAVACLWLVAVTAVRLIARGGSLRRDRAAARGARRNAAGRAAVAQRHGATPAAPGEPAGGTAVGGSAGNRGRIAA